MSENDHLGKRHSLALAPPPAISSICQSFTLSPASPPTKSPPRTQLGHHPGGPGSQVHHQVHPPNYASNHIGSKSFSHKTAIQSSIKIVHQGLSSEKACILYFLSSVMCAPTRSQSATESSLHCTDPWGGERGGGWMEDRHQFSRGRMVSFPLSCQFTKCWPQYFYSKFWFNFQTNLTMSSVPFEFLWYALVLTNCDALYISTFLH